MDPSTDPRFVQMAKKVDIFHGFSPSDIGKIFARGNTMGVAKDQVVFHKGTVGNQMFIVLGGSLAVVDGNRQLATLREGDTFGEMSVLLEHPRTATVKALENSVLFVLDERLFDKLLTKRVAVKMLMNLSRMLARRLQAANETLREREGR